MCIVTWEDYDGTILETGVFPIWSVPVYSWGTPTRESTAQYDYTFDDWNPQVDQVWNDTETYVATYTQSVRNYTITWENYDWTVLDTDSVAYGDTPSYSWATPTKPSDAEYDYTFDGWDPQISAVTWDATYTATFTATPVPEPFEPENSIFIEAIVPEEEEPEEEPVQTRGGPGAPGWFNDDNNDAGGWEWEEETRYRVKFFATDENSENYIRAIFIPSVWDLWEREYFWACDSQKFYDMQDALSIFTSEFIGEEWHKQFSVAAWESVMQYFNNEISAEDLETNIHDLQLEWENITASYIAITWISTDTINMALTWEETFDIYYSPADAYASCISITSLNEEWEVDAFIDNYSDWTASVHLVNTNATWDCTIVINDAHNIFEVTVHIEQFMPINRVTCWPSPQGHNLERVKMFLNAENDQNYIDITYSENNGVYTPTSYTFNWLSNTFASWEMMQDQINNIPSTLLWLFHGLTWDYVFDSWTRTYITNYFDPYSNEHANTAYLSEGLMNSTWMEPAPTVTCISTSWTTMYLGYYPADFLISNIADPNEIAWSTATSGEVLDVNSAYIDDNWDWTYTFRIDAYDTWTDEIRFYSSTNSDDVWAIFNMTVNPLTITDATNYPAYVWDSNVRFEVYGVYGGHLWVMWEDAPDNDILDFNDVLIDDMSFPMIVSIPTIGAWTANVVFFDPESYDEETGIYDTIYDTLQVTVSEEPVQWATVTCESWTTIIDWQEPLLFTIENVPDDDDTRIGVYIEDPYVLDSNYSLNDNGDWSFSLEIWSLWEWTSDVTIFDAMYADEETGGPTEGHIWRSDTITVELPQGTTVTCVSWTEIVNHTGSLELLIENFPIDEDWNQPLSHIGLDIEDYNVLDSASAQIIDNWDWTATIIVPTMWEWTSNVTVYDTAYDDGEGSYYPEGIWRSETVEVISGWTRIVCPTCQWTWQYYDESIWETVECMDCWWAWWRYEEPAPAPIVHAQWEACETCGGTWAVSHNNEFGETVFEPCPDCNWFWYFTWATAPTMYIDADHSTVVFGDPALQEYEDDVSMTLLEYCESDPNACGPEEDGLPSMVIDWDENWWNNPTDWNSDPIEHIIPIMCYRGIMVSPQEFDHTDPSDWWWENWSRSGLITLEVYWSWDWETSEYSWEHYDDESWETVTDYTTDSGTISNSHIQLSICWVNYLDDPAAGVFNIGGNWTINLWSEDNSSDPSVYNTFTSMPWTVTMIEPQPPMPEPCPTCAWSWEITCSNCEWVGNRECTTCWWAWTIPWTDPETWDPIDEPCPMCGWSGMEMCPTCNGSWLETCPDCGWTWEVWPGE